MKRKISLNIFDLAYIFADVDFFNDEKVMDDSESQTYNYLCLLYNSLSASDKEELYNATMSKRVQMKVRASLYSFLDSEED